MLTITQVYRAYDLVENRRRLQAEMRQPRVSRTTMLPIIGERGIPVMNAYVDALHAAMRDLDAELTKLGVSPVDEQEGVAGNWLVIGEGVATP